MVFSLDYSKKSNNFATKSIAMLERKFTKVLEKFLQENQNKILLVNGARQIGKSYLIRYVGKLETVC